MFGKVLSSLVIRQDVRGNGNFGTPRGNHTHEGIDLVCEEGQTFFAPEDGLIKRVGYPYSNDYNYHLIEFEGDSGYVYKFMYVHLNDTIIVGDVVSKGVAIGICEKISDKWGSDMLDHVHFEQRLNGSLVNPEEHYLVQVKKKTVTFLFSVLMLLVLGYLANILK